jgi:hypothetical protein
VTLLVGSNPTPSAAPSDTTPSGIVTPQDIEDTANVRGFAVFIFGYPWGRDALGENPASSAVA